MPDNDHNKRMEEESAWFHAKESFMEQEAIEKEELDLQNGQWFKSDLLRALNDAKQFTSEEGTVELDLSTVEKLIIYLKDN